MVEENWGGVGGEEYNARPKTPSNKRSGRRVKEEYNAICKVPSNLQLSAQQCGFQH